MLANDLLVVISRLRRQARDAALGPDLTPSQASALARIARGEAITASALARAERVRPQSIAATLAVLDARGLVVARPDPADGRRRLLGLTADAPGGGRPGQLVEGGRQERRAWLAQTLAEHFDAAERRQIAAAVALLERVT